MVSILNEPRVIEDFDAIVFTRDCHQENHCSFKENGGLWSKHCVKNT